MEKRRNTHQKSIIYETVISNCGRHMSADDIYNLVSKSYPKISKATVYRNLNVLSEEGKICKIVLNPSFIEQRFDDNITKHSHAICKRCGKVVDVVLSEEDSLEENAISGEKGFELLSHEIIFEGICRECRDKEKENGT